jgi:HSP20 family molecular chaperone IbpA
MNSLTLFNNKDILDRFLGFDDVWSISPKTKDNHRPLIKETEGKYKVSLIAPGLEKTDFSITVESNHLTISYDAGENKSDYVYATKYSKSYQIPSDADTKNISASYKNGVLLIDLLKQESAKPRSIIIK